MVKRKLTARVEQLDWRLGIEAQLRDLHDQQVVQATDLANLKARFESFQPEGIVAELSDDVLAMRARIRWLEKALALRPRAR